MTRGWRVAAGAAVMMGLALFLSRTVGAGTYEHARALGKRCSTCHDGTRPHTANLNAAGKYFLERRTLDGFTPPAPRRTTAAPSRAARSEGRGRAVYERACAVCHGSRGQGTALAGALTGPRKHGTSEAAVTRVITKGVPGTAMAAFESALSEAEIRDVARYVSSLGSTRRRE